MNAGITTPFELMLQIDRFARISEPIPPGRAVGELVGDSGSDLR
jgi:hypothetical protein